MPAAGVVMIIAVVLIVLALVYYLVSTIVALQKITTGLDGAIAGVVEIIEKTEPVDPVVKDINPTSTRASTCSRACSSRRPGMQDAVGLVEGLYRAPRRPAFATSPTARPSSAADLRGLHEGNADARPAGPRGTDRRRQPRRAGAAQCRRTEAWPRACCTPRSGRSGRRTCRARRSSAPTRPCSTSPARRPASANGCRPPRREKGGPMQTPAPFEYERATSVEGAIASLVAHDGRRADHRRRAQPAADDEAPAGRPRAPDRHQRSARARVHPRGRRRDPDRCADAPRRPAGLRAAGPARAGVRRRRGGDRRPGRSQPRHDRRLAVPGRCRRGSQRRVRRAEGERRDPRSRGRARSRARRVLPRPIHHCGRRRRDAHRDADPASGPTAAAPTRRSNAAPATGRSQPSRPRSGSTAR